MKLIPHHLDDNEHPSTGPSRRVLTLSGLDARAEERLLALRADPLERGVADGGRRPAAAASGTGPGCPSSAT